MLNDEPSTPAEPELSTTERLRRIEQVLATLMAKQIESEQHQQKQIDWFPRIQNSIQTLKERVANNELPSMLLSPQSCPLYIELKSDIDRIIASTLIMQGFNPSKGSVFVVFYEFPQKNFRRVAVHIKALENIIESMYGSCWSGNPKTAAATLKQRYDYLFDNVQYNLPDDITNWNSLVTVEIPKNTVVLKRQWRSMTFYRYLQLFFTVFQTRAYQQCLHLLEIATAVVHEQTEQTESEIIIPNLFIEDQLNHTALAAAEFWQRTTGTVITTNRKRKTKTSPSVTLSEYAHLKMGERLRADFYNEEELHWQYTIPAIYDLRIYQIMWNIWHVLSKKFVLLNGNQWKEGILLQIRIDMLKVLTKLNDQYREYNEQKVFNFWIFQSLYLKIRDVLPFLMVFYYVNSEPSTAPEDVYLDQLTENKTKYEPDFWRNTYFQNVNFLNFFARLWQKKFANPNEPLWLSYHVLKPDAFEIIAGYEVKLYSTANQQSRSAQSARTAARTTTATARAVVTTPVITTAAPVLFEPEQEVADDADENADTDVDDADDDDDQQTQVLSRPCSNSIITMFPSPPKKRSHIMMIESPNDAYSSSSS